MKNRSCGKILLVLMPVMILLCLAAITAGLLLTKVWWSPRLRVWVQDGLSSAAQPTLEVTQPATPAPPAPIVLTEQRIWEISRAQPLYEIDARFPQLEASGNEQVDRFNRLVRQAVNADIQSFKDNLSTLPDDPLSRDLGSTLRIDFTPVYTSKGLVSISERISFYVAGAAHPGSYSRAFNYDLAAGDMLQLSDLFPPAFPYLDTLSTLCINDLQARGVLAWEDGALPKRDNYRVWNITDAGLRITFDEYSVAPYASGTQTVTIPYSQIRDMLRPSGPLDSVIPTP